MTHPRIILKQGCLIYLTISLSFAADYFREKGKWDKMSQVFAYQWCSLLPEVRKLKPSTKAHSAQHLHPTILDKSVGTPALFRWKSPLFDFPSPLPLSMLYQWAESALFRSNIDQGGGGMSLCANAALQSVENKAISEHVPYFQAVPRTFVQDCSCILVEISGRSWSEVWTSPMGLCKAMCHSRT